MFAARPFAQLQCCTSARHIAGDRRPILQRSCSRANADCAAAADHDRTQEGHTHMNKKTECTIFARYKQALEEIRDHWANQYDHPRKQTPMYQGSYGIGVTDGHRACAIIAKKALNADE